METTMIKYRKLWNFDLPWDKTNYGSIKTGSLLHQWTAA